MPFFEGPTGTVHYRFWSGASPCAVLIFLHGLGQSSGHYHRFGRLMNGMNIDVWALDHVGHGLTEGDLLNPRKQLGDLTANALRFAQIVETQNPGLPIAMMGHSLGAATAIEALETSAGRFTSVILSATPEVMASKSRDLERFSLPVLAVHGVDDRMAPIDVVRSWAHELPNARLTEFENAGHDLLHEKVHRSVSVEVANFILQGSGHRVRTGALHRGRPGWMPATGARRDRLDPARESPTRFRV